MFGRRSGVAPDRIARSVATHPLSFQSNWRETLSRQIREVKMKAWANARRRLLAFTVARSGWKRALPLVLSLGLVLAVAGYAYSSGGPNAQLVGQDRIWGGGGTEPGCFVPDIGFCRPVPTNFAIDAHATGTGQAAYGDMVVANTQVQITCLAVDGQNAVVGGVITASPARPEFVGDFIAQFYVDNGTLESGGDLQSPFYVLEPNTDTLPAGFPNVCPSPDTGAPAFGLVRSFIPISRGDIIVQDGGGQNDGQR
jgi:hypothetical protein